MAKNRKSKKKKNYLKIIFILLIIITLIIFSYLIFTKLIVPAWERYKEEPVVTKEIPYKEEEEREEIKPMPIEEMVEVNLYFSDYQAMYLVPEKRKISTSLSLAKQVVIEIINGPENSNLYPTIPKGTQLNELYIADDIAYVDLSEEVCKNHPGGSSAELMTVYSIVNTLTEIPPIKGVQILINGNERETLVGHVDISKPLLRDEDWIKP